ncbi:MAG: hypothetical protein A2289_19390 [Deltaproteobacteria bacterium RIFOXYA12_FULL_58_15]|nr:MAG: hypothetical protein A2289_19390 [Deltaproteobacteria bacterium RIFOXYA12_FULL_58_15]OGR09182.1 MAG: hypothetical protein A2341_24395 [Deltaproteobacteria bacterium RIFOXYB12_FULL_58_9]
MNAHQVTSELAYDLARDHADLLLSLVERPQLRTDVVASIGSHRLIDRMVRVGLLVEEGEVLRASSRAYHRTRQEGMMSFLEHFVLPALTASVEDCGFASLHTRYLSLDESAARQLRDGRIQDLLSELTEVSDLPGDGPLAPMTVLVVGTSRVIDQSIPCDEQALRHLQNASIQRVTAAEQDLAALCQGDFLANNERYLAAQRVIVKFLERFASEVVESPENATYHLTVTSHWQGAMPEALEGSLQ